MENKIEKTNDSAPILDTTFDLWDHSCLQPPLLTGLQNISQILKCLKDGTSEVKHLILKGCNIIYECKLCCSLYRSLANFLAHKRYYCKGKNIEIISNSKLQNSDSKLIQTEYEEKDKENFPVVNVNESLKAVNRNKSPDLHEVKVEENKNNQQNNIISSAKITTLSTMKSRAKRLSSRTDCNLQSLTCLTCDTKYTSIKTLYLHMITIHSNKRPYYPCPFCNTSFVQMWGVTRHLTSVHNKSKEQINKLREVVRKNAFTRKVTATENNSSLERNKIYKNQRCCKCERLFNRKSSRVRHEKYCRKNSVTTNNKRKNNYIGKLFVSTNIENKVKEMIDAKKLICLKCRRRFSTFSNLRRHAAIHAGWTRYKCKFCYYQSYNRSDCKTHIRRMHSSEGDANKFIVDLPSVKASVTKIDSLCHRSTKSETTQRNLKKTNKSICEGITSDIQNNPSDALVTRSKRYPKIHQNLSTLKQDITNGLYLICQRVFSNEATKPSRLEEQLTKIHSNRKDKNLSYFQMLKEKHSRRPTLAGMFSAASKQDGLRASYNISLLIGKSGKLHTIREELIQ
ncbi:zinc finger protein 800-like [Centruroides sculpturatus]|uniref:zinc finger protein 800-like n=1 Tax=Centruroides sculpturatus TaxID=218467 RepID=UPI000C6D2C8E|nr:zinc finger protein 800-like [Centruroides sculpturatus]